MDWPNSYFTYSDLNISHIWHVLKLCHEKGWLYKGHRSMPWCARCGTALSQHEMIDSYREMTHLSVYVRFPIEGRKNESFLTWTTTPWTLPANVALAINPEIEYVRVEVGDEAFIVAKAAAEQIFDRALIKSQTAVDARALLGLRYRGPFDELPASSEGVVGHRVIEWKDVTAAEGTGLVHIAAGCGAEDFALSKTEKLPVLVPIDEMARFVRGYGWLEGKEARDVAREIADDLEKRGRLFRAADYTHRYPDCWRCHEEIVFRVDDEWFISMEELRPKLLAAAAEGGGERHRGKGGGAVWLGRGLGPVTKPGMAAGEGFRAEGFPPRSQRGLVREEPPLVLLPPLFLGGAHRRAAVPRLRVVPA